MKPEHEPVQEVRHGLAEALQALSTAKAASSGPRPRKRRLTYQEFRQLQRRARRYLVSGVALVTLGVLAIALRPFLPSAAATDEAAGTPREQKLTPAETAEIHAVSIALESKFPLAENARDIVVVTDHNAARRELLTKLSVEGREPRLINPSDLKPPAPGKPLKCYCLLLAPLDPDTEIAWTDAGYFRDEAEVVSPYLRHLTLENAAAMSCLDNAFVDRVCLDLCPPPETE